MAVVPRTLRSGRVVFWIAFYDALGEQQWERVGFVEREAEARDRLRQKQVADGTYEKGLRPTMPFGEFLTDWLDKRTNRNAKEDRSQATRFLLTRKWLCKIKCEEMRPRHALQLVEELKATISEETKKVLSPKYVSNLYGLFATACRDARIAELMPYDPCVLPKGKIRRKSKRNARTNYEAEDVIALLSCPDDEARVFALLALLTGMREGEVCGRRWRDLDRHSMPLGCLAIESQYDDQPLKGDKDEAGEAARKAPVHPLLDRLLAWWWSDGFRAVYGRQPTRDDWIVPRRVKGDTSLPHTKSSGYKLWRRACDLSDVKNRSLHSTRHTFLTLTQRGGAQKVVIEKVTHNAAGDTVDQYTHWAWSPLCEAVMCLKLPLGADLDSAYAAGKFGSSVVEAPGIEVGANGGRSRLLPAEPGTEPPSEPPKSPHRLAGAVSHCAGQETPTADDTTAATSGSADADGVGGVADLRADLSKLGLSDEVVGCILDIRQELALAWSDHVRKAHAAVYGGSAPAAEVAS